jgi:hypothetical protein
VSGLCQTMTLSDFTDTHLGTHWCEQAPQVADLIMWREDPVRLKIPVSPAQFHPWPPSLPPTPGIGYGKSGRIPVYDTRRRTMRWSRIDPAFHRLWIFCPQSVQQHRSVTVSADTFKALRKEQLACQGQRPAAKNAFTSASGCRQKQRPEGRCKTRRRRRSNRTNAFQP